jgi:hypothetical protein
VRLRLSARGVFAITGIAGAVSLAGLVAGPASATVRPEPGVLTVRVAGTTYSTAGGLYGVAAASARQAWAVGYAGDGYPMKVLMLHWNGAKWSRVTSPSVLTGNGDLSAITVVSAKDAWAVGATGGSLHSHTLIMHWNGSAWSQVTSPAPVANGSLSGVTANAKGGWAVGSHSTGPSVPQTSPVIFRLTGTKWSRVDPQFGAGSGVTLDGVATTSASKTFASGLYTGMITGVLAQWSGSSWTWVKSFPEEGTYHWLNAIAAGPQGTAFAVGINTNAGGGVISIKWTGKAWVKAPAPATASLYAVSFAPGGTAWAAGSSPSGSTIRSLGMRWNGSSWSPVSSPAKDARLDGLGFATAKYGWAVGDSGAYTSKPKTLILHWDGHSWS